MNTLTTLSIALFMAFAFGGLVAFTSTDAHAGEDYEPWWCDGAEYHWGTSSPLCN
ncbi:MAG: hypothetical protein V6Z81_09725 [Parvularculales bacterium]